MHMQLEFDLAPEVDVRILNRTASRAAAIVRHADLTTDSYGPRVEMLSSHEDVIAAYGALAQRAITAATRHQQQQSKLTSSGPTGADPSGAANTTATVAGRLDAERKRQREEGPDRTATSQNSANDALPPFEPSSTFAGATTDYQGRTFLHVPSHMSTQAVTEGCRPPNRMLYAMKGHSNGVQCVRWCPPAGHLIFSADLSGCVKLWDVSSPTQRVEVGQYNGHRDPIRSLQVSASATRMSTASVDGYIRQWDVESGQLLDTLRHPSGNAILTHMYHPFNAISDGDTAGSLAADARLIIAAVHDKMVLWDLRDHSSRHKPLREYSGHMGAIMNISFLDGGRKILTTSEDKTLRTWEFRVPVQIKQFADASMHALSHVLPHPTEPLLAAQSFDNRIVLLQDEGSGRVKFLRDRDFSGHTIAGSACQLAFSPDGQFISSGDVSGQLHIWKWRTGERVRSFAAHASGKALIQHAWHPNEKGRVVTAAWDGLVKVWG